MRSGGRRSYSSVRSPPVSSSRRWRSRVAAVFPFTRYVPTQPGTSKSKDGISRFVVFDLDVDIETDEGCVDCG